MAPQRSGDRLAILPVGFDKRFEPGRVLVRREAERARRDTFSVVAGEFIEKYAKPRNRRWAETDRIFNTYVIPEWGTWPIEQVARRDVIELLEKIGKERGGYMSNRTLAAIRRLFAWCVEREVIETSPAANVRPIAKPFDVDGLVAVVEEVLEDAAAALVGDRL